MTIQKATPSLAYSLTALTFRSKAHSGYSAEQMELWCEDLTITTEYITEHEVYVLLQNGELIGYYSYFKIDTSTVKLDNLFIHPTHMRKGLGRLLMDDFMNRAKQAGFQKITLDADPHAESFYTKLCFTIVGQLESSIPNRFLPIMEFNLNALP